MKKPKKKCIFASKICKKERQEDSAFVIKSAVSKPRTHKLSISEGFLHGALKDSEL